MPLTATNTLSNFLAHAHKKLKCAGWATFQGSVGVELSCSKVISLYFSSIEAAVITWGSSIVYCAAVLSVMGEFPTWTPKLSKELEALDRTAANALLSTFGLTLIPGIIDISDAFGMMGVPMLSNRLTAFSIRDTIAMYYTEFDDYVSPPPLKGPPRGPVTSTLGPLWAITKDYLQHLGWEDIHWEPKCTTNSTSPISRQALSIHTSQDIYTRVEPDTKHLDCLPYNIRRVIRRYHAAKYVTDMIAKDIGSLHSVLIIASDGGGPSKHTNGKYSGTGWCTRLYIDGTLQEECKGHTRLLRWCSSTTSERLARLEAIMLAKLTRDDPGFYAEAVYLLGDNDCLQHDMKDWHDDNYPAYTLRCRNALDSHIRRMPFAKWVATWFPAHTSDKCESTDAADDVFDMCYDDSWMDDYLEPPEPTNDHEEEWELLAEAHPELIAQHTQNTPVPHPGPASSADATTGQTPYKDTCFWDKVYALDRSPGAHRSTTAFVESVYSLFKLQRPTGVAVDMNRIADQQVHIACFDHTPSTPTLTPPLDPRECTISIPPPKVNNTLYQLCGAALPVYARDKPKSDVAAILQTITDVRIRTAILNGCPDNVRKAIDSLDINVIRTGAKLGLAKGWTYTKHDFRNHVFDTKVPKFLVKHIETEARLGFIRTGVSQKGKLGFGRKREDNTGFMEEDDNEVQE